MVIICWSFISGSFLIIYMQFNHVNKLTINFVTDAINVKIMI